MDKERLEQQKFLQEQVIWCKEQDRILEKIECKLYKMKEIAEFAREFELDFTEVLKLNEQLADLKKEICALEKQLHVLVH